MRGNEEEVGEERGRKRTGEVRQKLGRRRRGWIREKEDVGKKKREWEETGETKKGGGNGIGEGKKRRRRSREGKCRKKRKD